MIWIPLIGMSHSSRKGLMSEFLRIRNGLRLRLVVGNCNPHAMSVLKNIMCDGTTFWATLRFWFYINVCHSCIFSILVSRTCGAAPIWRTQVKKT
jgi:hypothetical protein